MIIKGANLVFVGLPTHSINIEEPAKNVVLKSITMKTVYGRRIWSTWEACENLIADGKVPSIHKEFSYFFSDLTTMFSIGEARDDREP